MNFGKAVISFLLLLTYSFGFAHNLIPHYQEFYPYNHSSTIYHHQHHQHTLEEDLNADHDHILHKNHYDAGIYDLIVCFFSETQHPANGCNVQHYLPTETINVSTRNLTKIKFVAVLLAVFSIAEQSESTYRYGIAPATYLSPTLEDSPNRGPPSISCLPTEALA